MWAQDTLLLSTLYYDRLIGEVNGMAREHTMAMTKAEKSPNGIGTRRAVLIQRYAQWLGYQPNPVEIQHLFRSRLMQARVFGRELPSEMQS